MKENIIVGLVGVFLLSEVCVWGTATTATHAVSMVINGEASIATPKKILKFSLKGSQGSVTSTYSINNTSVLRKKIIGTLDAAMPVGTHLFISMEAPPNAISQGLVELTSEPNVLVSQVQCPLIQEDLQVTYTYNSTSKASPGPFSRALYITLIDD